MFSAIGNQSGYLWNISPIQLKAFSHMLWLKINSNLTKMLKVKSRRVEKNESNVHSSGSGLSISMKKLAVTQLLFAIW